MSLAIQRLKIIIVVGPQVELEGLRCTQLIRHFHGWPLALHSAVAFFMRRIHDLDVKAFRDSPVQDLNAQPSSIAIPSLRPVRPAKIS